MVAPANVEVNRVAVLASKRGSAPLDSNAPFPSAEPHLFLFDLQGRQIWKQPLPQAAPANLAFSPDGEKILVSVYSSYLFRNVVKKTLLLQSDGTVLNTFPFLMKQAAFARLPKSALIADRFTVRQIDLESGKLLWEHHFLPEKGMVAAVKLDSAGKTAAVLTGLNRFTNNRFEFYEPRLYLFDRSGSLTGQISFNQETFLTPALHFQDGAIFIGFTHNLYKTEVQ